MRDFAEAIGMAALALTFSFAAIFLTVGLWAIGALYVMGFLAP